jgi:hypothetical protein
LSGERGPNRTINLLIKSQFISARDGDALGFGLVAVLVEEGDGMLGDLFGAAFVEDEDGGAGAGEGAAEEAGEAELEDGFETGD